MYKDFVLVLPYTKKSTMSKDNEKLHALIYS